MMPLAYNVRLREMIDLTRNFFKRLNSEDYMKGVHNSRFVHEAALLKLKAECAIDPHALVLPNRISLSRARRVAVDVAGRGGA